jgi:hypothetical protein
MKMLVTFLRKNYPSTKVSRIEFSRSALSTFSELSVLNDTPGERSEWMLADDVLQQAGVVFLDERHYLPSIIKSCSLEGKKFPNLRYCNNGLSILSPFNIDIVSKYCKS